MKKGPKAEKEIVQLLRSVGFPARRTMTHAKSDDIDIGREFKVEVKHRLRWSVFDWIRKARAESPDEQWALFCIHGARQTEEGRGVKEVMVVDATFGARLLALWDGKENCFDCEGNGETEDALVCPTCDGLG